MTLLNELMGLGEAKKPKCTCEKDEATCKVHSKKLDESSAEYDDSAEFTEDWLEAHDLFEKSLKIISDPKFNAWLQVTDDNYGTNTVDALNIIIRGMTTAKAGWVNLNDGMDEADNG